MIDNWLKQSLVLYCLFKLFWRSTSHLLLTRETISEHVTDTAIPGLSSFFCFLLIKCAKQHFSLTITYVNIRGKNVSKAVEQ